MTTDPFAKIDLSRRTFVRQLATGAFAVPALLSFTTEQAAPQASPLPSMSQTPGLTASPTPTPTTTPTPTATPVPSSTPPPPSASAGPAVVPFEDFVARGDVELKPGLNDDQFTVNARFTLGAASDGIDPVHEAVTFTLGPGSWTIPAGSFHAAPPGHSGLVRYTFSGVVGTTDLDVDISQQPDGTFRFKATGRRADLTGITNPAPFSLRIGNDAGATVILLEEDDDD